ncbi:ImmA/IrrE family metallo-endopeptidase [Zavarzinella formosa]|uniref:ImmA/IrrE family metallo-endopeptidase n=1 Tax=Zavarzinella formosa TaxID=360055 RepID=UPI00031DD962|nr:ImmA/IrrE family metallo-endopeptidase [Zavarzinella formosa]
MTPPVWILELARVLPTPTCFPRDFREELAFGPANVVVADLPRLTTVSVSEYLGRCGLPIANVGDERPLQGCVFAWRGEAFLFVSNDDAEDEQRYTLAHEMAHVLRHYRQPRERCVALMGTGILAVLDGDRPPTPTEAIHGALRGVPLGPHLRLIDGKASSLDINSVEAEADRLACELLAPAAVVRSRLMPNASMADIEHELTTNFGLPSEMARIYAREFVPLAPGGGHWLKSLTNNLANLSNS